MGKLAKLSTSELYPPEIAARTAAILSEVWTEEQDPERNAVIRRALTAEERRDLQARSAEIAPFIPRATDRDAEEAVLAMFTGLGGDWQEEETVEVRAAQYATVLVEYGLPLWSIARACLRFAAGDVKAEDVGERQLSFRGAPSSAHVRILATKIAQPIHRQAYRIGRALRATVARPEETPEQRAVNIPKFKAIHEAYRRGAAALDVDRVAEEEARRAAGRKASEEASRRFILADYERAGVEPVYADGGKTILVPLSTMRRRGFEVRDLGQGERALVGPAGERP